MSKAHLVVLGFLNYEPMHGYRIMQIVQLRGLDVWAGVKLSSIYKAMQTLENSGCIFGKQETENNNPPRMVYHITEKGKLQFRKLILAFLQTDEHPNMEFWLAVSLIYKVISKAELLELVEKRINKLSQHLSEQNETALPKELDGNLPFTHKRVKQLGIQIHKSEEVVLNDLLKDITNHENDDFFIQEGEAE